MYSTIHISMHNGVHNTMHYSMHNSMLNSMHNCVHNSMHNAMHNTMHISMHNCMLRAAEDRSGRGRQSSQGSSTNGMGERRLPKMARTKTGAMLESITAGLIYKKRASERSERKRK